MFGRFQDIIRECVLKMINTNSTKFNNLKQSNTRDFYLKNSESVNLAENEFKDRSDKLKVFF
jgi:hypothetical protein